MKTIFLTGNNLAWAFAKAKGYIDDETSWMHGLPPSNLGRGLALMDRYVEKAIDEHRICTTIGHGGVWIASTRQNYDDEDEFMTAGNNRHEAAARCFVLKMLGSDVEIPE